MTEAVGGNMLRLPWDMLQRMFPAMTVEDKTALALTYKLSITPWQPPPPPPPLSARASFENVDDLASAGPRSTFTEEE